MKKNVLVIILLLFLVAAIGTSYYFYNQYQNNQKLLQNPTAAIKEQTKALIDKIGKLIELPKNEEPTTAVVTDKNKLKDQPFFVSAENGDQLLIYTKAKKAILYRPSTNKIIDIGPVSIGNSSNASGASQIQQIKVALDNGTLVSGLIDSIEAQLKAKITNIAIVSKNNASKRDYLKTLVIDLTGKNKEIVQQLARVLDAEIADLPKGEVKPADGDLLIILGKGAQVK